MQTRQTIRQTMRNKRKQISVMQRMTDALKAANHLLTTEIFANAKNIACYMAKLNEFNTTPIIEQIWQHNKNCYLPILDPDQENNLIFGLYEKDTQLIADRFGILEPSFNKKTLIEPKKLDLVLLPLTAFDAKGHRIGTGGGYYDRTFAFLKKLSKPKPFLCGVGYSFQEFTNIPAEKWDIDLHAILTENGFHYF